MNLKLINKKKFEKIKQQIKQEENNLKNVKKSNPENIIKKKIIKEKTQKLIIILMNRKSKKFDSNYIPKPYGTFKKNINL